MSDQKTADPSDPKDATNPKTWALSDEAMDRAIPACSRPKCKKPLVDADGKRVRGYVTVPSDSRKICFECWNEWRLILPLVQRLWIDGLLYRDDRAPGVSDLRVVQVMPETVAPGPPV